MSIINKIKKLNSNNAAQLFKCHPLAGESFELRLQYLASLALAVAIDREPTENERQTFSALANSLSVDTADAEVQLNERASVSEDDIAVLFDAIRQKSAAWIYLLDLAWLHIADGATDETETEATEQLAMLLEIDASKVPALQAFASALKGRDFAGAVKNSQFLPDDSGLQNVLPELLGFQRYEATELVATSELIVKGEHPDPFATDGWKGSTPSMIASLTDTLNWKKQVGDIVKAYDIIATIENSKVAFAAAGPFGSFTEPVNKVAFDIAAPFGGVIQSVKIKGKCSLNVGDVIGILYRTEFYD